MEDEILKDNQCWIEFRCNNDDYSDCVYGKPIDYIPCYNCETYIKEKLPPFKDHCHACDKMYEWNNCRYLGNRNNCTSTIACVNKAVLYLKEVGLTIENLQNICTE